MQHDELTNEEIQPETSSTTENTTACNNAPTSDAKELQKDVQPAVTTTETMVDEEAVSAQDQSEELLPAEDTADAHQEIEEMPNYFEYSLPELVAALGALCVKEAVESCRAKIEEIRMVFYKKLNAEIEAKKAEFVKLGNAIEDFSYSSTEEHEFKTLYTKIKNFRAQHIEEENLVRENNLQKRLAIIEELKELVNKEESMQKTFDDFKKLQERWKEIGQIPQSETKNVWEQYHHQVGVFYDYVKINKELRDLDLKKNLEAKIELCEKAEALHLLIAKQKVVDAFKKLQKLHDLWREIGPVVEEKKAEVWQRFKNATTAINKAHQDYFSAIKQQETENYERKLTLCEKLEELIAQPKNSIKEWNATSQVVTEIQKQWKTIGFALQKYNAQIYERYCNACNSFFEAKRNAFAALREVEDENKQKKIDLCIQAEALKQRTDWKQATDEFVALQQAWKEIGYTTYKDNAKLWSRFRAACDEFFNARQAHFKEKDDEQITNYNRKQEILQQIINLEQKETAEETLTALNALQKEWLEIGLVPIKKKDKLNKEYNEAVQQKLQSLQLPPEQKQKFALKNTIQAIKQQPKSKQKFTDEIGKLRNKISSIQAEIVQLETNIEFFAKSKNADALREEVNKKIAAFKKDIDSLKQQIRMITEATKTDEAAN
ncbi:MAG: DUF349 domain-containing protein [Bacteroidales bacterium]|jgi:hypothetical protein|nr:DUF349 domain-containing protein [Bacteroidales bacterium]